MKRGIPFESVDKLGSRIAYSQRGSFACHLVTLKNMACLFCAKRVKPLLVITYLRRNNRFGTEIGKERIRTPGDGFNHHALLLNGIPHVLAHHIAGIGLLCARNRLVESTIFARKCRYLRAQLCQTGRELRSKLSCSRHNRHGRTASRSYIAQHRALDITRSAISEIA